MTGLGPRTGTRVFGAMASYRTTSPAQQRALATAAARLADDAGFPLLVDLRPGLVVLDSGKDRWDADAHGLALDFADLAADLQAAARGLGAAADPGLPRFVQLVLDAADVAAVRAFWVAALGYVHDRRGGVTDIVDPRRLDPVLVLQDLDASDTARRRQRNRIHVELAVPPTGPGPASPPPWPPGAGCSTSPRTDGGSPTPRATSWWSSAGDEPVPPPS